jgi:hypothetical protein
MTSTQQNEASQAVRLLYKGATEHNVGPEALYQARVLLEGFIKSAGVLESTEGELPEELIYEGMTFRVGEDVYALDPSGRTVAVKILRFVGNHGLASVENDDMRFTMRFRDMLALNPQGSHK